MSSEILYAGQYKLYAADVLQAKGVSVGILDQIHQVTIYEDLFSPFMTGNIIIQDTLDLPSVFLNAGADLLRLRIGTPSLPDDTIIDRFFHIYKVSDRIVINNRSQTYVIHFVSSESLVDSSVNISKTYRGKGEANIASILSEVIKTAVPFSSDSTSNDITYTSNYWSPIKNIAFNATMALNNGQPCMTFFESRKGFEFKSLELMAKKPISFNFDSSNHLSEVDESEQNAGAVTKNFDQDFKTILRIDAPVYYDYYKDKNAGLMSSRLFSFDMTTKKITDITYNASMGNRPRMDKNAFYTKELIDSSYRGTFSSTLLTQHFRHNKLYDGKNDVSDLASKQARISIMRQFQQHKIELTVLGRTDYTVGIVVEVNANRLIQIDKDMSAESIRDPIISGKYLVSATCHIFGRDGKHETILELIKDAIGESE